MIDGTREFLNYYTNYVNELLKPTQEEVKFFLRSWREPGYWKKYVVKSRSSDPSPIQHIRTRIKRPESVVDKILRKPGSFPKGMNPVSLERMNDAFGARAVTYFLSGLPLVDQEIRSCGKFEICTDDPPKAYLSDELARRLGITHIKREDKESGYAAIHYILRLSDSKLSIDKRPWFELQVRTLVEDAWGEIEHILGYKPGKRTSFAVRKQFKIISAELAAIDEHFNFLYEELLRFQSEVDFRDADPLNAENLPPLLSDLSIGCAQQEVDGLLKLLVSRGISTVALLRKAAPISRLEIIRNTYRVEEGRLPKNFEIVACLASVPDIREEKEIPDRIKAHISYLRAWEGLKKNFIT
jgi:putative GTP pyrophosphokinase